MTLPERNCDWEAAQPKRERKNKNTDINLTFFIAPPFSIYPAFFEASQMFSKPAIPETQDSDLCKKTPIRRFLMGE
jgi:hypothetical protein